MSTSSTTETPRAQRGTKSAETPRAPGPQLRIYAWNRVAAAPRTTHHAPGELSPQMRVSDFHRCHYVPHYWQYHHLSALTLKEADCTVRVWAALTGDPPLREITSDTLARFAHALLRRPAKSGNGCIRSHTVKKHLTQLEWELRLAGPRTRECKEAATEHGLFAERDEAPRPAPFFPPIRFHDEQELPKIFPTGDEIAAWLDACAAARVPRVEGCTPAEWWRALIQFGYFSALRISTIRSLRRSMVKLIEQDGQRVVWLDIPGRIAKGNKSHGKILDPRGAAALAQIATPDLIFPWPHAAKHLQTVRQRLQSLAGIPPERQFGFHALRRANADALSAVSPEAARQSLDHEKLATTMTHYVSRETQVRSAARETLAALKKLPSLRSKRRDAAEQQMLPGF